MHDFESHIFASDNSLVLQSGEKLESYVLAYNTYGKLNRKKSNAILICHALTGDQHVANQHPVTHKPGWWEKIVGPGKAIDTQIYFVICINCLGGCQGSTGPASIDPATQRIYGLNFPIVTIADMVHAQCQLVNYLGIEKLLCVIGGSMGGMQVLQWAASYPERLRAAIPIATSSRHTPQNIAFHEVGRQAVIADNHWHAGRYQEYNVSPKKGLAVARMVAHVTYLSEDVLQEKFGRNLQERTDLTYGFDADFQIESYLRHQGVSFVDRFDANSYLYLTRAMDYFDLVKDFNCSLNAIFKQSQVKFCVISFTGDWLFPSSESKKIAHALAFSGVHVSFVEIDSEKGHDAFLLNEPEMFSVIKGFIVACEEKES